MISCICKNCGGAFSRRPSMVGKFCSHSCAAKFNKSYQNTLISNSGAQNHLWKGARASYAAIHSWVRRWKGKAQGCFICVEPSGSRFEWANVSGLYLRDLNDYISLCAKHHRMADRILANGT